MMFRALVSEKAASPYITIVPPLRVVTPVWLLSPHRFRVF